MKRVVAVIGGSSCTAQQADLAERVGQLLADSGVVLVCGGGGGVMEAACRGSQQHGGTTVGLLPGTDRKAGNPHLTIALPTGLGQARNVLVAQSGEAVIAIGGSAGTLSEIALAVKRGVRVVSLNSWQATDADGQQLRVAAADDPEQAVSLALEDPD